MTNFFNPLDPMNASMYLESTVPYSIDDAIASMPEYPHPNPNGPKLRPQPSKDSWYYNKDGADDGRISTFEKLKAFAKGGTYNMIRGMFCDKDGFSIGRTLATAAGVTAIVLTGPIGAAIAGGVGLVCAADNFAQSVRNAKTAVTDQQAREAYEGVGESASTAGLSLFGGFKGFTAIKNNFAYAKNNKISIPLRDKLMKWDVSKLFPVKPASTTQPSNGTTPPTGNTTPPAGNTNPPAGNTNPPAGNTNPPAGNTNPPAGNTNPPTGNPTQPAGNASGSLNVRTYEPSPINYEIDARGYVPDWKPVGYPEKPVPAEYASEWAPAGDIPKPVKPEYFSPYEPTGNVTVKPSAPENTTVQPQNFVPETAPIETSPVKPSTPPQDFTYGTDNNHFFG